jgi:PPOX class probable F420-dependent enzyme
MNTQDARRRFTAEPVARLATVGADGRPHLVPVTFAVIAADERGGPAGEGATGGDEPAGASAPGRDAPVEASAPGGDAPVRASAPVGDGSVVVFAVDRKPKRSTRLRRLANIAQNPQVAFLADRYRDDWSALWWVRADAVATVVSDPADARHRRAVHALIEKYPQYRLEPPAGPVVWAAVTRWSGWAATAGADPVTAGG